LVGQGLRRVGIRKLLAESLTSHFECVLQRDPSLDLSVYYLKVLENLGREKARGRAGKVLLFEIGCPLAHQETSKPHPVYLISDINGLMLQPQCRTLDRDGQVLFTDTAELLSSGLVDEAEKKLRRTGRTILKGIAAAVAAPLILSPAERSVLAGMGAEIALTHTYLEARAARARGIPTLGIASGPRVDMDELHQVLVLLSEKGC